MQRLLDVRGRPRRRGSQHTGRGKAIGRQVSGPSSDGYRKSAPLALLALNRHRPAMQRNQFPHERQADSGPLMSARFGALDAVETLEETRQFRLWNADAGVRQGELCVIAAPLERNRDAALEGVLEGIRKEVEHN